MKKLTLTASIMIGMMAPLRKKVVLGMEWLNHSTHGWLRMLVEAVRETLKPNSSITAAAIAFFAVLSLFPLTLLSISIGSLYLGPLMDQQLILQKLEFIAPALGSLLGQNITEIIRARGPVTVIAVLGLVWSASTIFSILNQTLNEIWNNKHRRPVWKQRGLAILIILAFVGPVLFLASFAGSMITNLRAWLPVQIVPIFVAIGFVMAILLDVALFMLLYFLLPHGPSTWRDILPGALGAGLFWELAKKAFLLFISSYISLSNLVYGSVTAIIAFLSWAYLSGLIFLLGAHISVSYYRLKQQQIAAEAN